MLKQILLLEWVCKCYVCQDCHYSLSNTYRKTSADALGFDCGATWQLDLDLEQIDFTSSNSKHSSFHQLHCHARCPATFLQLLLAPYTPATAPNMSQPSFYKNGCSLRTGARKISTPNAKLDVIILVSSMLMQNSNQSADSSSNACRSSTTQCYEPNYTACECNVNLVVLLIVSKSTMNTSYLGISLLHLHSGCRNIQKEYCMNSLAAGTLFQRI